MWFVFGRRKKTRAVRGGRAERRTCPKCDANTTFFEVKVEKTYTAYVVVDLLDTESTAFICKNCDEVMDLGDTLPPKLSPREQAKVDAAKAKAAAERQRRIAADAAAARAETQQKEEQLDDALAAMKARLGID